MSSDCFQKADKLETCELELEKNHCGGGCGEVVTAWTCRALPTSDTGISATVSVTWPWVVARAPLERIAGLLPSFFGLVSTGGGPAKTADRAGLILAPVHEEILGGIGREGEISHADETGLHAKGRGWWLWVFGTYDAAYPRAALRRYALAGKPLLLKLQRSRLTSAPSSGTIDGPRVRILRGITAVREIRNFLFAFLLCAVGAGVAPAFPGEDPAVSDENRLLKERLARVEEELAAIKRLLAEKWPDAPIPRAGRGGAIEAAGGAPPPAQAKPAIPEMVQGRPPSAVAPPAEEKRSLNLPPFLRVYGQVELDLTWDSNKTRLGDPLIGPMLSEAVNRTLDISAKPSRLGVDFALPAAAGADLTGKVELDFNTSSGKPSSPNARMRHAYAKANWKRTNVEIIAGQTDDLLGLVTPDTISYPVENWVGDIGYRRPQIRFTKTFPLRQGSRFRLQAAMSKLSGFATAPDGTSTEVEFPALQTRLEYGFTTPGADISAIGVFSSFGQSRYSDIGRGNFLMRSWAIGIDFNVNLTKKWNLMGEFWTGIPLNLYYQFFWRSGVLADTKTVGGWASVTFKPNASWRFNLGGGFDDPRIITSASVENDFASSAFVNFYYDFAKHWEVGVELSRWYQEKTNSDKLTKNRVQGMFLFKF